MECNWLHSRKRGGGTEALSQGWTIREANWSSHLRPQIGGGGHSSLSTSLPSLLPFPLPGLEKEEDRREEECAENESAELDHWRMGGLAHHWACLACLLRHQEVLDRPCPFHDLAETGTGTNCPYYLLFSKGGTTVPSHPSIVSSPEAIWCPLFLCPLFRLQAFWGRDLFIYFAL